MTSATATATPQESRQVDGSDCPVLDAARAAVTGRGEAYGPPDALFALIAARWSLVLGVEVRPEQIPLMMMDLKLARLSVDPAYSDGPVDIAGYAETLHSVIVAQRERGER